MYKSCSSLFTLHLKIKVKNQRNRTLFFATLSRFYPTWYMQALFGFVFCVQVLLLWTVYARICVPAYLCIVTLHCIIICSYVVHSVYLCIFILHCINVYIQCTLFVQCNSTVHRGSCLLRTFFVLSLYIVYRFVSNACYLGTVILHCIKVHIQCRRFVYCHSTLSIES